MNRPSHIIVLIIFILAGNFFWGYTSRKRETPKPQVCRLELSLGGEVKSYQFDPSEVIHVIADEEGQLTDIQLLPTTNRTVNTPAQLYGQSTN